MKSFENRVKESLEGYEAPYDAAAWQQMATRLDTMPASSGLGTGTKWMLGIGGTAVVATGIWFSIQSNHGPMVLEQAPAIAQPMAQSATNVGQAAVAHVGQPTSQSNHVSTSVAQQTTTRTSPSTTSEAVVPASNNQKASASAIDDKVEVSNADAKVTSNPTPSSGPKPKRGDVDEEILPVFEVSSTRICLGEDLVLINNTATSGRATGFHWEFGDGATSDAREPQYTYTQPGLYRVILQAGRKGLTQEAMVEVLASPTADVQRNELVGPAVPYFQLSVDLQPGETVNWTFGDGGKASGSTVTRLFRNPNEATASVTVKNAAGCAVTDKVSGLNNTAFNLLSESAFTPNIVDWNNDTFLPVALRELNVPFTFTVTDPRTGQEVYKTSDLRGGWNGRLNNAGDLLPRGKYQWTVVLGADIAKNRTFTGLITKLQ